MDQKNITVEAYITGASFLVGGIIIMANTAAVVCKSIVRLRFQEDIQRSRYTSPVLTETCTSTSPESLYFETDHLQKCDESQILRQRNISSYKLQDNRKPGDNISNSVECSMPLKNPSDTTDPDFIKLFFMFCVFENIYIFINGCSVDEMHNVVDANCNISSAVEDFINLNTVLSLRKKYLFTFLHTIGFAALTVFPIILYLTNRCCKSFAENLICSAIILLSAFVSRCCGFLFFPHLQLQITSQGYLLERILSSWIAFFSMGLGVKLVVGTEPKCGGDLSSRLIFPQSVSKDIGNHLEQKCYQSMSDGCTSHYRKTDTVIPELKLKEKETFSNMAGSDAFVPCVVLMKKQNSNPCKRNFNIGMVNRTARTRRRASLDVIKERNCSKEASKWPEIMYKRRTSLPAILASSKKKTVMSSVLMDTATLVEVHATLDELAKAPSNFAEFVKKLQNLLKPYKADHIKPRQVVWLQDSATDGSDEDTICLSTRHSASKRTFVRRSDWQTGQRDLFSTTTTATGLPKEEPGPVKPKRLPKIAKDKTPTSGTPLDSRCESPVSDVPISTHIGRRRTYPNIPVSYSSWSFAPTPKAHPPKKFSTISSDYESCDNEELPLSATIRSKSDTEGDEHAPSFHYHCHINQASPASTQETYPVRSVASSPVMNEAVILEEDEDYLSKRWKDGDLEGHAMFDNYQEKLLESVYEWNFRIFELAGKTHCVLSQMAFKLFQDTGLFETFSIPKREFVCYMQALENGYRRIPYHNRIHAADVLHGCWFLSTQEIPGFQDHSPLFSSDSSDSDSGTGTNTRQVNNIGHGSLAQAIPALELMSLYLAAAMHDYDHPGRTNAFLVETRHPLAILYNDRSVLENHHASASWELLHSNKNFDFLRNLETAEWKRLRFLIVEAILATDLKKHFEILSQFNNKAQCLRSLEDDDSDTPRRTGINWSADEDRLLVCQMVIKLADIGGPAKHTPLHITWTKAICEEFFVQGDEERKLGVPVSPFMDRERPQVAELQRTFINNLIKPIVQSMHKTGILAGKTPDLDNLSVELGHTLRNSLLLEQLKDNLNFWKKRTSGDGQAEMNEAFQYAITVHSSSTDEEDSKPGIVPNHRPNKLSYENNNKDTNSLSCSSDDDNVFDNNSNNSLSEIEKTCCKAEKQTTLASSSGKTAADICPSMQANSDFKNKDVFQSSRTPLHARGNHITLPAPSSLHTSNK
ncbi:cGMP-inhibited 3',5'-cyclic phosphodiesterase 3A-like isoform X1 [Clavelina lepadiformis]|uniref:cGMP-inhibited 3',5'-cyclic phosphodiesterase 3A-like isoform X1 n=1 Tax=Clavelina lepadiformis TaxID=159417 RepID=UPI004041A632